MDEEPFLKPRLTGDRFAGHTIPLEVLKDLAVLEELIPALARVGFLRDHPDRKNKPKGFTDGLELRLAGVEPGSAKPLIVLAVAVTTLLPSDGQHYMRQAADELVKGLAEAEAGRSPTPYLPEDLLSYFDRFGRSLKDDEAVCFPGVAGASEVKFTPLLRRKLVLSTSKNKFITEEVSLRGTVPEADQDAMSFELQLDDGRKVPAPLAPQHVEDVIRAFAGYASGMRVSIDAVARYDRKEKLLSLDSVERLTVLDALDVPSRLDEFREMEDGWLDGEGKAPDPAGLDWLAESFLVYYPDRSRLPRCYPTVEGGVQMEWENQHDDASLAIDLAAKTGRWHVLNFASDRETVEDLPLDQAASWSRIGEQIDDLFGASE